MRDPQWLFIFSVLLATAVSLECEVCKGIGSSCTGKMKTCNAGQDTCVTTIFENSFDGKSVQAVAKGCESSKACTSPPINMNLGEGKFLRMSSTCCKEGTCTHVSPKMAPEDTQTNGKQCPSCYDTTGTCGKEKVDCTGSDMYCFDFTLGLQARGTGENITMKGCTTRTTCDRISNGKFLMLKDQDAVVRRAGCTSGPSQVPQPSELLLSTFTSILLMEIFS